MGLGSGGNVTGSYWNNETSGQTTSAGSPGTSGRTTADLQAPLTYSGIYAGWNVDTDNADGDGNAGTGADDPWDFGAQDSYPQLKRNGTPTQIILSFNASRVAENVSTAVLEVSAAFPEGSGTLDYGIDVDLGFAGQRRARREFRGSWRACSRDPRGRVQRLFDS